MKIGLKRTFFPVIAVAIVATLLYGSFFMSSNEAEAQIAVLYASTCLGGWKNPDRASGVPEVAGDTDVSYGDDNSATLSNTMTQLFCAGFTGDIPKEVDRTDVSIRFSWHMESQETFLKERIDNDDPEYRTEIITVTEPASTTKEAVAPTDTPSPQEPASTDTASESTLKPAAAEPEESAPAAEPETVSWRQWLMPFAYAQAESEVAIEPETDRESATALLVPEPEVVTEHEAVATTTVDEAPVSASTTDPATNTATSMSSSVSYNFVSPVFDQNKDKDNALLEVLFTIDNVQWHSLGYVSRINNDISFDLPVELFPNVEDFNKLQISLESVERIDDTPIIYLDSLWVEMSYVEAGEDPLSPPGSLPGDVITNTYTVDNHELVTVFRNVGLETISNILMITASTATSTEATASTSQNAISAEIETITTPALIASSSDTSLVSSFDAPVSLETKNILRETPGVLVELWLHNLTKDTWMRVADDTITGTLPRAVLIETKVFWFGPYNSSVWVFDSLSQGYSSQSISPHERVSVDFINSTSEASTVWFNPGTEMLEVLVSNE